MTETKRKINRKLCDDLTVYTKLSVWSGDRVMAGATMIEDLFRDQVVGWTEDDLIRYVRKKYGNRPLHIRAIGRVGSRYDWLQVPKLMEYERPDAEGARAVEISIENRRLMEENRMLREELSRFSDRLATMEATKRSTAIEEEEEIEEEQADPITEFIGELATMFMPMLKQGIAQRVADMVTGSKPKVERTGLSIEEARAANAAAIPPVAGIHDSAEDPAVDDDPVGEYDIPVEVLEFLDKVDWDRADTADLIATVTRFNLLPMKETSDGKEGS